MNRGNNSHAGGARPSASHGASHGGGGQTHGGSHGGGGQAHGGGGGHSGGDHK